MEELLKKNNELDHFSSRFSDKSEPNTNEPIGFDEFNITIDNIEEAQERAKARSEL